MGFRGRRRSPKGESSGGHYRRDDRRYSTAPRERRRRSPTDRFRRNGSPPFKRGRYGRDGGYDDLYDRHSPVKDRHDGPRPYKDFCRDLPDDVTPTEAQNEYQKYLAGFWGSEIRAEFECKKNDEWMKARFDPRGIRKSIENRNEEARISASTFSKDVLAKVLDPESADFNQGVLPRQSEDSIDADDMDADFAVENVDDGTDVHTQNSNNSLPRPKPYPQVSWHMPRVIFDLKLSHQLIKKLDAEKEIVDNVLMTTEEDIELIEKLGLDKAELGSSWLDGKKQRASETKRESGVGANADSSSDNADKDTKDSDGKAQAETRDDSTGAAAAEDSAAVDDSSRDDAVTPMADDADEKSVEKDVGFSLEYLCGRLDLRLSYLWRVHAVDYYQGVEYADVDGFASRLTLQRTLRPPKAEGEDKPSEAEERKEAKLMERKVDQEWKRRLLGDDPFALGLHKGKIDKLLEEWIEDQIKPIDENKWGCKLSQKLFVGKDYVLKHIRLKHEDKIDAQKEKIIDDVYWGNYKQFKEKERDMLQAEMARVQQGLSAGVPWNMGVPGPFGGVGGAPALAPMGGMITPPVMPQPGQVLVLAPGLVTPGNVIMTPPIAQNLSRRGVMTAPPPEKPYGDFRGGGHMSHYVDLDNPSNNRSVLDYGDL